MPAKNALSLDYGVRVHSLSHPLARSSSALRYWELADRDEAEHPACALHQFERRRSP